MRKKFLSIIVIMFFVLISLTNVQAKETLFNYGAYTDIYKLSEQNTKIDLPFVNMFTSAVTYDEVVKHSGITFGDSTIDVNEKLEGVHVIFSTDMVTIKGEVEHALIYANNIVVEGKISGDTVLIAPTVKILETAAIAKDVIVVANNLELNGIADGNVIATVSEKATISGEIKNDLRMIATAVEINSDNIQGNIYIETDADMTSVKEKYPNAVVETLVMEEQQTDWMAVITQGIITVVIYSIICYFITRKENNIAEKAYKKFKSNIVFGIIAAFVIIMLLLVLPLILILLGVYGLGIIAWPILTIQIASMILIWQLAILIAGTVVFEAIKTKVEKFKIPVIAIIFAVIFALTQITYIAMHVNMAIYLIAIAIVTTYIMKKFPKEELVK